MNKKVQLNDMALNQVAGGGIDETFPLDPICPILPITPIPATPIPFPIKPAPNPFANK